MTYQLTAVMQLMGCLSVLQFHRANDGVSGISQSINTTIYKL